MLPFRLLGRHSPLAEHAESWIRSLTPEFDGEQGNAFWEWILEHHGSGACLNEPLLDTYFFCRIHDGKLVATASLVQDDRDVGEKYDISGIWLGGVMVKWEERNAGIMKAAFHSLDAFIQAAVDARGAALTVNLFTTSPPFRHLCSVYRFESRGFIDVEFFGKAEERFEKVYNPRPIL